MDKLTRHEKNWAVAAKLAGYPCCSECLEPLNLEMQAKGFKRHPWCSPSWKGASEGRPPLDENGEWYG